MRILSGTLGAVAAAAALLHTAAVPAGGVAIKPGDFVYIHDRTGDSKILGFSLSKEGVLAALPGSPFQTAADGGGCGGFCQTMAWSKKRKLLFTGAEGGGIGVHRVLPGGAVEDVAGSPFGAGGGGIWGVGVVQRGARTFVYGSAYQTDQVRGFEVQADGTLVELDSSPFPAGDGPDGLAAVKNVVFAMNENAGTISSYAVAADGSLVSSGDDTTVDGVDFVYDANPDAAGKFLYVAGCDQTVAVFQIDRKTGALAALEGSPFDAGVPDACVGAAVSRRQVVVPSNNDGPFSNLQVFKRERDGSVTAQGGLQDTGITGAENGTFDPKGRIFVAANDAAVQSVLIDPRTGAATMGAPLALTAQRITCVLVVHR